MTYTIDALRKELHKMGIKTYKNKKTQASFVKRSDVLKVLAADSDKELEIYYQTSIPGSDANQDGEYDDQGEHETRNVTPDEYDIEEGLTAVDLAERLISNDYGAVEPSASPTWNKGVWYTTVDPSKDYKTGEDTYYTIHLKNFSEDEEKELYEKLK